LWLAFSVSTTGIWMASLGAQWFLVSAPGGDHYVALVQSALSLPMALLAIPAGVLADNLDRRRLLIVVQAVALAVASVLAMFVWSGLVNVWWLLILITLLGVSNSLSTTPFQSLIPDLVPRKDIPSAAALLGVGVNVGRIIGPAVAGVLVVGFGVGVIFALTASTSAMFLVVLLLWSGQVPRVAQRERFFPAVRTGIRYVRHSPQVLRVLLRSVSFAAGMSAMFALLALIATQVLALDSGGYGALLGCIGLGAVAGALSTGRVRARLSANATVALCFVLCAVVIAVIPFVTIFWITAAVLTTAGWGWTVCLTTMVSCMQLYLPAWVRARGLATYWLALFGGQAMGSIALGAVAAEWGLPSAFLASGLLLGIGALLAIWLPIAPMDHIDRTPSMHWPEPELVVDSDDINGEVMIQTIYWVDRESEEEFLRRMIGVRTVRLRTGGTDWRLFKDAETLRRFVEEYSVSSWQEHQYQLHNRLVASDRELELLAAELSEPPPRMRRLYRFDARS
jgi:predicted MFS family arabinose efflux permease